MVPQIEDALPTAMSYVGYSPLGRCSIQAMTHIDSIMNGEAQSGAPPITIPALEPTTEAIQYGAEMILPGVAGFASNLLIARAVQGTHPAIAVGSMLVLPFVSSLYAGFNGQNPTDLSPRQLIEEYEGLMTARSYREHKGLAPAPEDQQKLSQEERTKQSSSASKDQQHQASQVHDITKLIPLLR